MITTPASLASEQLTSIKDIEVQFALMTQRIKQALINHKVDVFKLIELLQTISAVKEKEVPLFDDDVFKKVQSIEALWKKLSPFWSIFDYDLLRIVIKISECNEAEEIFVEYLSRIYPIEDVDLVIHYQVMQHKGSLKPVLRVKINSEKCTASIREKVKDILSKAFNLEEYALRFVGIKMGCIELHYCISKPLKLYILQCKVSESIVAELLAHEVFTLYIDGFEAKVPSKSTDAMVSI